MAHVLSDLNDRLGIGDGGLQELFTFDMSPLQKAFVSLATKVDQCQKENAALRAELADLKISKRLDSLEQGLQELADVSRSAPSFMGMDPGVFASNMPALASLGTPQPPAGTDPAGFSADRHIASPPQPALGPSSGSATAQREAPALQTQASASSAAGAAGLSPAAQAAAGAANPGFAGFSRFGSNARLGATPSTSGVGPQGGQLNAEASSSNGGSWVLYELTQVKERVTQMERKAETIWHAQQDDEQLRGTVERLRTDIVSMQSGVAEAQSEARAALSAADKQSSATAESAVYVKELQDRVHTLELQTLKGTDERREMTHKYETTVSQIWDQLRHVEGSLGQRLTMAETSHVAALQEVDEAKEATSEVLQRVDDIKRHTSALENKLESFNTQVAAAISPLHNSLAAVQERLEGLAASKQDIATAIKTADVDVAVARAIDHADRRADNLLKSIAGVEQRLEELADATPNKGEVVLTSDLEALLTEHAHELDGHLDRLKADLLAAVALKVDREELAAVDGRLVGRLNGLEGAILKGLKAISDKVSSALAEKLDLLKFNEFKLQVRAILADVEDRLRDWSPAAVGMKSQLAGPEGGSGGAPSCLCCDTRVRAVRDLRAMGFKEDDRVFSPEKLPQTDPLLPNITVSRNPTLGAHHNARLVHKQAWSDARMRSATVSVMESVPGSAAGGASPSGGQPGSPSVAALSMVDPSAYATLSALSTPTQRMASAGAAKQAAAWGAKVEVETVAGMIGKGQLPGKAVLGGPKANGSPRAMRPPVAAAAVAGGLSVSMVGSSASFHGTPASERPALGPQASLGSLGMPLRGESSQSALNGVLSPWGGEEPSPSQDKGPVAASSDVAVA